jgi:small subunit ribosomal protein S21
MQVLVRDNNVEQALRVLKKKMQREGIFRELRQRKAYEKPSEKKNREKAEAIRRTRKAARKQMQRDGLLPAPKLKPKFPPRGGAGAGGPRGPSAGGSSAGGTGGGFRGPRDGQAAGERPSFAPRVDAAV